MYVAAVNPSMVVPNSSGYGTTAPHAPSHLMLPPSNPPHARALPPPVVHTGP